MDRSVTSNRHATHSANFDLESKKTYDITQDVYVCKNTEVSFQEILVIRSTHFLYSYFLFKNMQDDSDIQN